MVTLEQIIISRGDIEKIYRSKISLTLWRAVNKSDSDRMLNPLYPDFKDRELPNGRIRLADVSTYKKGGEIFVKSEESRGTSLSDNSCLFGSGRWDYVVIPKGTKIPAELIITKDHYISSKKCWHYSISPNFDMPVSTFKKALDQLALDANIKCKAQAHG